MLHSYAHVSWSRSVPTLHQRWTQTSGSLPGSMLHERWKMATWTRGNDLVNIPVPWILWVTSWLVSTQLKNISQIGSFPQVGVNIPNISNHHPGYYCSYTTDTSNPEMVLSGSRLKRFGTGEVRSLRHSLQGGHQANRYKWREITLIKVGWK